MNKIETLYMNGGVYRQSWSISAEDEVVKILSEITNSTTREIVLNNLQNITCVSKGIDGVIYFYVMGTEFIDTVCYKVSDSVLHEKNYVHMEPDGYIFSDINLEQVFMYGVSGTEDIDVYMSDLSGLSEELAAEFQVNMIEENHSVFYGCKMRSDGSTYRYKTYHLSNTIKEQHNQFLQDVGINNIQARLELAYL